MGKVDNLEVNFVAMDGKETRYYQVAAMVRDKQAPQRELASLQKINDHYPKQILRFLYKGIIINHNKNRANLH